MSAITSTGAFVGTDRLGRGLTNDENKQLARLLREHDFTGASMVALKFAYKLSRGRESARDLVGRTNLRLMRWGWDPADVSLVKRLCRLVWSEFTHQKRETAVARRAEEAFLREHGMDGRAEPRTPSAEDQVIRLEEERAEDARKDKELALLRGKLVEFRAHLDTTRDEVNLLWVGYVEKGVMEPAAMAKDSGRPVTEFYAAARRRNRFVEKLLAVKSDEPE